MKLNSIYCGDCIDVMGQWDDNIIDLTVTSPPYDNLRDYKGFKFDFLGVASQLWRITKPGGVVVWVVGDATIKGSETCSSFKQAICFTDYGFRLHDTMIYAKNNYLPGQIKHKRYASGFEYMFVFSKDQPKTFIPIKEKSIWGGLKTGRTFRKRNGQTEKRNSIVKEEKIISNIWFYNVGYMKHTLDKFAYKHPAMFPEKLAHDHIVSWSNEGDIVLDPMCGSGTTLKEAVKLNRQFIGIDTSAEYCSISQERINNINA
ncbi:hypothetical protein LCGC14_0404420 [marine sediment metagenome]|uniref:site-specific DNA-methyltransferase (cytosine-N(4)-specific) n=1 Tax=marine sediment metagenome TaxID=412755 RepID=A0A0F9W506_9ZZZZ